MRARAQENRLHYSIRDSLKQASKILTSLPEADADDDKMARFIFNYKHNLDCKLPVIKSYISFVMLATL